MANYLKGGAGTSRKHDEAMEIGRPLTPRSERPRSSYGSLMAAMPSGGCTAGRKCVLKAGHQVECWPKDA